MKAIKATLPNELKSVELHTFADFHIGDAHCDMNNIRKCIKHVKETDNAYAIINGDILNNATKTSVSDCYAEKYTPDEQIQIFQELFEPIKDKILAITSGNHENRSYIKEGIDIMRLCARSIGKENVYGKDGAFIFLRFGSLSERLRSDGSINHRTACYRIYATHGGGGGRKEGSKAVRMADMAGIVDADIYIHSHTHLPIAFKEDFFRPSDGNSTVVPITKLFVNSSAKLRFGGYGEAYEFKPATIESPVILLDGSKKDMKALV